VGPFRPQRVVILTRKAENGSEMATALLTHPDCLLHEMGPQHPESPNRLRAILNAIESAGLIGALDLYEAPEASAEQLLRVHSRQHVDYVRESAPEHGYAVLDPDTSMNPKSLSAACRAAGAVVTATDLVLSGRAGASRAAKTWPDSADFAPEPTYFPASSAP
jgi:acetoin utilization deacetylase AcuC-like enzyme